MARNTRVNQGNLGGHRALAGIQNWRKRNHAVTPEKSASCAHHGTGQPGRKKLPPLLLTRKGEKELRGEECHSVAKSITHKDTASFTSPDGPSRGGSSLTACYGKILTAARSPGHMNGDSQAAQNR
ncbi:hypothetical protein CISG_09588 [Coccidioides immitis RMSCC 3703]|uniref:Uncharacterized protein n=1 Tax=Coccidioides immitis RMSCC 3703 TaxID=454286 RepID=A0A0J8U5E5_COCIT|nr:hypothetical protein CISG_09588 [Coccidioides immitis RMSCC 3703]